jgi:uncharacterized UPF0160 family protein
MQEHLYDLETEIELKEDKLLLYVVYPDEAAGNWRIQAVPVSPESFENRKSLPYEWRGLRDSDLTELAAISGCIFVHSSGFIGGLLYISRQRSVFNLLELKGNATREGALAMARAALNS